MIGLGLRSSIIALAMRLPSFKTPRRGVVGRTTLASVAMSSAGNGIAGQAPPSLSSRYFQRIGIDPTNLDTEPTLDKLKVLQERHLATIPFENLSQHGLNLPAALDLKRTAHKILDRRRGGFCFEVNGLFGSVLAELGYGVTLVPAQVYSGTGFGEPAHMVLIVTCEDGTVAFSDVGFGEPPLHPLLYDDLSIGRVQVTPEGMRSKLVRVDSEDGGDGEGDGNGNAVYLYWDNDGEWVPRLRWSYSPSVGKDTAGTTTMEGMAWKDFQPLLETVLKPSSIFSQKTICCLLTRNQKVSLAGNKLKVTTGNPRLPEEKASISVHELESVDEVRQVLQDHFGIPLVETMTLDLRTSLATIEVSAAAAD